MFRYLLAWFFLFFLFSLLSFFFLSYFLPWNILLLNQRASQKNLKTNSNYDLVSSPTETISLSFSLSLSLSLSGETKVVHDNNGWLWTFDETWFGWWWENVDDGVILSWCLKGREKQREREREKKKKKWERNREEEREMRIVEKVSSCFECSQVFE